MKEQIKEHAKKWLQEEKISGFLALRQTGEHVEPFLFRKTEELEQLSLGDLERPGASRYPLIKILMRLQRIHPQETLGVMIRGCEERAFEKLVRASQLDARKVLLAGFPCSAQLAKRCGCLQPYPQAMVAGTRPETPPSNKVITATPKNFIRDLQFMKEQFERCVKCYGCRNICPMCFCKECTLEEDLFVPKTGLPPANPDFLLTRAVHMVGYCVYCGLCEEGCPAHIPLKIIYKMVANIMNEQQGIGIQGLPQRGSESGETHEKEPGKQAAG